MQEISSITNASSLINILVQKINGLLNKLSQAPNLSNEEAQLKKSLEHIVKLHAKQKKKLEHILKII